MPLVLFLWCDLPSLVYHTRPRTTDDLEEISALLLQTSQLRLQNVCGAVYSIV